ncbi:MULTISPECIES: 16S rRNA (cytosine(967)-C(5))-methyltransferase RsmB [unclassified Polaromonas]|uniref:16S rRNA (cytosine(967)-C(5))-methyltransferase RsmB n=1 Tax=unclassified Polaromonas TaxID=2638319 RepID=UPI000F074DEB|nr:MULTISPECIES: 16S rRNA (cytosine(967)-C(5))-methyltransferase RsmB [unclassified Polaromonas]AYQ28077.1 16S rRNA (cytosine(967)-C(5))-methyltransferase RsmB [Polaromonas sp. SP1]QGJ17059.1 16S rRNA (cytosine(967)-C(5))-methyltransferase RsmB [Polaromonas sp. Pch-P]
MQDNPTQVPLWRQLQGAASLLMAVRDGQSMTAALEDVDGALRPGVQSLGFHTLRWLGRAEALRQQLARRPPPPEADALLCVALALIWTEHDAPYTAHTLVDQAVEAAKRGDATQHQASFINGCLRRFLRERDELVARTEKSPQAVWNHPQWWIDRVRKDHPDSWQAVLQANNSRAPLILRVNERKTTQAQYLSALSAINIEAAPVGKHGVILARAQAVSLLPGFAEGHFSVQDAAAQLAAPLLLEGLETGGGANARLNILDACAAPGGKTAHLLELADCEVTALDIDARRCERVKQNLQRLGLQADIRVGDAGKPDAWWDGRLYDGILLDAPCTASGIVRRHPDVRWLRRPTDIPQLADIQAHLLKTLWPLLKAGGRLLYCTCSVFRAEGDNQIQTFLTHHTDASLKPSPGHLLPQSGAEATVFPDNLMREHDGFYYALLEKRLG